MAIPPERDVCEQPSGRYANYLVVGHNECEFVLDFGQVYEATDPVRTHTRIVTPPMHARAMAEALLAALGKFEAAYGPIRSRVAAHGNEPAASDP
jgi:hypothetical protein